MKVARRRLANAHLMYVNLSRLEEIVVHVQPGRHFMTQLPKQGIAARGLELHFTVS